VLWIAVMPWICYVGIEASAKTQWFLLGAEVIILGLFAVVALGKVYFSNPAGAIDPSSRGSTRSTSRAQARSQTASSWRCSSTGAGTARSR
jgi:amino acid transporter